MTQWAMNRVGVGCGAGLLGIELLERPELASLSWLRRSPAAGQRASTVTSTASDRRISEVEEVESLLKEKEKETSQRRCVEKIGKRRMVPDGSHLKLSDAVGKFACRMMSWSFSDLSSSGPGERMLPAEKALVSGELHVLRPPA